MNTDQLSKAVRARAERLHTLIQDDTSDDDAQLIRDTAECCRVLARMVGGAQIGRAFGAPGDWGYTHPIGQALAASEKMSAS